MTSRPSLPEHPRIGIVVPTADPERYPAKRCLEHVRDTTGHLDVDLRVVVGGGPDFRIARSINRGIAESADADAWVLLNDDAFMDAGWLDAMIDAARAHDSVGVVGALLRYEDGRVQHAGGRILLTPLEYLAVATRHRAPFWALRNLRAQRFRDHAYMFDHYRREDARHRLDFMTGACVLITRACHERIGGYDEAYSFGAEDVDHSLRALEAGFELALATRATGIHLDRTSGAKMAAKSAASEATFRERWDGARIRRVTRAGGRTGIHA